MDLADLDVLIVDDHEAMRALLTRVLTKAGVTNFRTPQAPPRPGVTARTASNGDHRRQEHAGHGWVGVSCRQCAARARLARRRSSCSGGDASAAHAAAARAAGADMVLVKPVPPSALLAAINELFAV
ncbi:MAG: hypothetical protein IPL62_04035 [Caulobacteraceae bacterium]|nr:hypothetical protein [Caulobacteraceae bacterium]